MKPAFDELPVSTSALPARRAGRGRPEGGWWLDAGGLTYADAYRWQEELVELRQRGEIPDTILVVEHPACLTMGRAAASAHVLANPEELAARGITVHTSDRGGSVTYHGPGQLVCYPVLDLRERERDVHLYARQLEEIVIRTAGSFGVEGWRRPGLPGVWTAEGKLAALGLAVRRWVTLHGVALNVCPDLSAFSLIVPCGLDDGRVTSLEALSPRPVTVADARAVLRRECERVFARTLRDAGPRLAAGGRADAGVDVVAFADPAAADHARAAGRRVESCAACCGPTVTAADRRTG